MSPADPSEPPRLFVIRHSDTDWTDAHRHTGSTNIPLNSKGQVHARLLARRLADLAFTKVFASPLDRVRQTCELAGFGSQAEVLSDLTEWDMGDDEGRTTAAIRKGRPDWDMYRDGAAGGENLSDVAARAGRFVTLAQTFAGDTAAFASGQIIRCIAARWLGLPPIAAKCFSIDTCSVGVLSFEHNLGEPVVSLWNDVGHLASSRSTCEQAGVKT